MYVSYDRLDELDKECNTKEAFVSALLGEGYSEDEAEELAEEYGY